MATRIYATSGDTNKLVNATLSDDGVAVDLSAVDAIECHVRNRSTGTLTTVTGLTGNASGQVSTTIPGPLNAGMFTIEWEVTDGTTITTYPGSESTRPLLIVRQEADSGGPEPAGGWWAVDVGIVDAGGYYASTDVEAALQEVGADLAALPAQYLPGNGTPAVIPLAIPTPDGDLSVTHPSVVIVPDGWNGYTYWMAFTPWPDASRENPCVVASLDGVNWELPTGATNPIFTLAQAQALSFNNSSDTELLLLADGVTMAVYWRMTDSSPIRESIYRTTSTDGATWTTPVEVVAITGEADDTTALSPSVVLEDDGTYSMWTVNLLDYADPYEMEKRTSADGLTWSAPSACTTPDSVGALWHTTVQLFNGRYYCLVNIGIEPKYRLALLESADGITWTWPSKRWAIPILDTDIVTEDWADEGHYRSAFVPVPGSPLLFDVWVATRRDAADEWRIIYYKDMDLRQGDPAMEVPITIKARTSRSYVTPHASVTTATLGAGNMRITPIFLPRCTINEIGVEITTGVALSVGRVGIYSDDGQGAPSTLLAEGTVTTTANAFVYATITALTLDGGLYWLAFHSDTASSGIGYRCTNTGSPLQFPWTTRPTGANFSGGIAGYIQGSIAAGAMPPTIGSISVSPACPIMWVRTSSVDL